MSWSKVGGLSIGNSTMLSMIPLLLIIAFRCLHIRQFAQPMANLWDEASGDFGFGLAAGSGDVLCSSSFFSATGADADEASFGSSTSERHFGHWLWSLPFFGDLLSLSSFDCISYAQPAYKEEEKSPKLKLSSSQNRHSIYKGI